MFVLMASGVFGRAGAAITSLPEFSYLAQSIISECVLSAPSLYLPVVHEGAAVRRILSAPILRFWLYPQCVHWEVSFAVSFQMVDLIQVPRQRVAALLKEQRGGETKRRFRQSPTSEHKALQNWRRNMAIRKKQERNLGGERMRDPVL